MTNVFITGVTGFIGSHLVRAYIEKGFNVKAFVLPDDPGAGSLKTCGADIVYGDIREYEKIRQALRGMDIVAHCAAVVTDWAPARLFKEVTVDGTENICKASFVNDVDRLVVISTNDVFGRDETYTMDEKTPFSPWNEPYPDSKIEAEKIVMKYGEQKLPISIVYPCWVYGEGDKTFVPLLADAIIKKEMIFWRKNVIVWPTYVKNLADLILKISQDDRAIGQGYLVHDGESTTLQYFCGRIADALEVPFKERYIPYPAAYLAALVMETAWKMLKRTSRPLLTTYTVKNLGSRFKFSISKAELELGWTPAISFEEGMNNTLNWLKQLDPEKLKEK